MSAFPETLSQDQGRLHRLQAAAKRNPADAEAAQRVAVALSESRAAFAVRASGLPGVQVDANLPVGQYAERLRQLITDHPVVVVAGETGSGKTTQIPKICLSAGRGIAGMIGCTQPRRISATSVAQRVASERCEALGVSVGFSIRLQQQLPRCRGSVTFCTTGVVLRMLQTPDAFADVSHLIIDEVHERDVHTDFLLAAVKKMLPQCPHLKLLLMSAAASNLPLQFLTL